MDPDRFGVADGLVLSRPGRRSQAGKSFDLEAIWLTPNGNPETLELSSAFVQHGAAVEVRTAPNDLNRTIHDLAVVLSETPSHLGRKLNGYVAASLHDLVGWALALDRYSVFVEVSAAQSLEGEC